MDQRIGSAFVLEDDRQTARKASQRNGKDEIGPRRASKGASDRFAGKEGQGGETGLPLFPGPADPLIAGRDLPCGGPEAQAGERGLPGSGDVADLGSGKGLLTDFPGTRHERGRAAGLWERDQAVLLHPEQGDPADPEGQSLPVEGRLLLDPLSDMFHLLRGEGPAQLALHAGSRTGERERRSFRSGERVQGSQCDTSEGACPLRAQASKVLARRRQNPPISQVGEYRRRTRVPPKAASAPWKILTADCQTAEGPLGGLVALGDPGIVDKEGQSVPVLLKAF